VRLRARRVVVGLLAAAAPLLLAMQPVRDAHYRVIGYLDPRPDGKVFVRDCHQRLLGWSDARGTYDANGKKLYASSVPDLLLSRSACVATPTPVARPTAPPRR
jgi:hypothetical protein